LTQKSNEPPANMKKAPSFFMTELDRV